jgi:hypothetical protein
MPNDHGNEHRLMQASRKTTGSSNGSCDLSQFTVVNNQDSDQIARNPTANSSPSICGGARLGSIKG